MMNRLKDLTGQKFGRLTVIRQKGKDKNNRALWLCLCECGTEKIIMASNLRQGNTKSCGCLHIENGKRGLIKGEANFNYLYGAYKRRAKKKNLVFELSKDEFRRLNKSNCHYCGRTPRNVCKNPNTNGAYIYTGVDRVNTKKGYTLDNVVPCCGTCNYAKKETSVDEFFSWVNDIYNHSIREEDCDG